MNMVDKFTTAPAILESYNKQVEAMKTGVEERPSQPTQPDTLVTQKEFTEEMKE